MTKEQLLDKIKVLPDQEAIAEIQLFEDSIHNAAIQDAMSNATARILQISANGGKVARVNGDSISKLLRK